MSLERLSMLGDWQSILRGFFPRITPAQLAAFEALRLTDALVDDHGKPTRAMQAWVAGVAR